MATQSQLIMATPHLDTMAKGLPTLSLRQMQDTIEDMDIVYLDTMGMADMDSMDVDIMEKGLQILKPMLDTCTEVMDTMVSDISMDMDLAMAGVTIMVRLPWTLCLRFIFSFFSSVQGKEM